MKYNLLKLETQIESLKSQCIDELKKLLQVIGNLANIIRSEFDKIQFENKFNNGLRTKLINLLVTNNFKVNGILGQYIWKLNLTLTITDEWDCYIEITDDFDRSHFVETEYTTANGRHVIKRIKAGKIIDMVDAGRNNYNITARRGSVVKRNGKRYRWLVYRAKARSTEDFNYYKQNNYENYDPTKKDQRIMLVPDKTTITVNGSTYSNFGIGLYQSIQDYMEDKDTPRAILGKRTIDEFIDNIIERETKPYFDKCSLIIDELVKCCKKYELERNKIK